MTSTPPPYGLIATDLDGTLLRSDETVSERTRAALGRATAAGAAHIVVTGRSVAWTRHILDALDYRGLAVCGQGAQVYHAGEHRLLTSVTLDRQLAGLAVAKIEAEVGPLFLAASRDGLDGDVLVGPGYRIQDCLLYTRDRRSCGPRRSTSSTSSTPSWTTTPWRRSRARSRAASWGSRWRVRASSSCCRWA